MMDPCGNSSCGSNSTFTFQKIIPFTGWRGCPAKHCRGLAGVWASAQSLFSCLTSTNSTKSSNVSLNPPPPPLSQPYDARQHLALAVLSLFSKHGGTKTQPRSFSLATWLGIAATAALSTPTALAEVPPAQAEEAAMPPALRQAWHDLHAPRCSRSVLRSLSVAPPNTVEPEALPPENAPAVSSGMAGELIEELAGELASQLAAEAERGVAVATTAHHWLVTPVGNSLASLRLEWCQTGTDAEEASRHAVVARVLPAAPTGSIPASASESMWQQSGRAQAQARFSAEHLQPAASHATSHSTTSLAVDVTLHSQVPAGTSLQTATFAVLSQQEVSSHSVLSSHQSVVSSTSQAGPHGVTSDVVDTAHVSDMLLPKGFSLDRRCHAQSVAGAAQHSPEWPDLLRSAPQNKCQMANEASSIVTTAAGQLWAHHGGMEEKAGPRLDTTGMAVTAIPQRRQAVDPLPELNLIEPVNLIESVCATPGTTVAGLCTSQYLPVALDLASASTAECSVPCCEGHTALGCRKPAAQCDVLMIDPIALTKEAISSVVSEAKSGAVPGMGGVLLHSGLSAIPEEEAVGIVNAPYGAAVVPAVAASHIAAVAHDVSAAFEMAVTPARSGDGAATSFMAVPCDAPASPDTCIPHAVVAVIPSCDLDSHSTGQLISKSSTGGVVSHVNPADSMELACHVPHMAPAVHLGVTSNLGCTSLVGLAGHVGDTVAVGSSGIGLEHCINPAPESQLSCSLDIHHGGLSCATANAVLAKFRDWKEHFLGNKGLDVTLAVLGVPFLEDKARSDILKPESALRLDHEVLQALEYDIQELESQAHSIQEDLRHITNHPPADSWEVAEGHLDTLDEYLKKASIILGRVPPCTEESRSHVFQLVVPPLVQCARVCSAGLSSLLGQQRSSGVTPGANQKGAELRSADVSEQLEMVRRFVHIATQVMQELRDAEVQVPSCNYAKELGHAVHEVYAALSGSASRVQAIAIGTLAHTTNRTSSAELDWVLAMTRMWRATHKLRLLISTAWPDFQGSALCQLAECHKHAVECFARFLKASHQPQRKKGGGGGSQPPATSGTAPQDSGWSEKVAVSGEEVGRMKRVLDLLGSLLNYSKATYRELMQKQPPDKADARRYVSIQDAFFEVSLSLARRSSRWTGSRLRSVPGPLLAEVKRCQSNVLRFVVEWDKSCLGAPGHKQMAHLQEITFRLVKQYMALQRQSSSRDSLSTPRHRQITSNTSAPSQHLTLTRPFTPGTLTPAADFAPFAVQPNSNASPFSHPVVQAAADHPSITRAVHAPDQFYPGVFSPGVYDGAVLATGVPAGVIPLPLTLAPKAGNPFAMAAQHGCLPTPMGLPQILEAPPTTGMQPAEVLMPTSMGMHHLNPFATPSPPPHPSQMPLNPSNPNNSPFNNLALHSRLQSVVDCLNPSRNGSSMSPTGSIMLAVSGPPTPTSFSSSARPILAHSVDSNTGMSTCLQLQSPTKGSNSSNRASSEMIAANSVLSNGTHNSGTASHAIHSSHGVAATASQDVGVPGLKGAGHSKTGVVVTDASQIPHNLASPTRASHAARAPVAGAGQQAASVALVTMPGELLSDMFLQQESSKGVAGDIMSPSSFDDFGDVKWEEVLGANVRDWFTGKTRLGRGSYGEVYKACYYHSDVAVKVLPIRSATIAAVKQEIDMLQRTRHPNVVRFLGACMEPLQPAQGPKPTRHLAIVMELCDIGTLHATINKARHHATRKRDPRVQHFYSNWLTRLDIARGIAAGTDFLHARNLVHRDLTSYNVLLHYGVPWQAKVADFGLSRDTSGFGELNNSGDLHSPGWRAPELLIPNSKYTSKADVYSFGVILWELLTLRQPWEEEFDKAQQAGPRGNLPLFIRNEVVAGARLPFPDAEELGVDLPEVAQVVGLAERCWRHNPDDRPTMEEVVQRLEKIITKVRSRRK